jgi:two-component system, cell cycle response regulator
MDVLMPDMDGYEGCKRIRSLKAKIGALPVLMLTSKSSPFDRIRGKMAGCDAYLTKPVQPELLHAALAPYLGAEAGPATSKQKAATPAYAPPAMASQR